MTCVRALCLQQFRAFGNFFFITTQSIPRLNARPSGKQAFVGFDVLDITTDRPLWLMPLLVINQRKLSILRLPLWLRLAFRIFGRRFRRSFFFLRFFFYHLLRFFFPFLFLDYLPLLLSVLFPSPFPFLASVPFSAP